MSADRIAGVRLPLVLDPNNACGQLLPPRPLALLCRRRRHAVAALPLLLCVCRIGRRGHEPAVAPVIAAAAVNRLDAVTPALAATKEAMAMAGSSPPPPAAVRLDAPAAARAPRRAPRECDARCAALLHDTSREVGAAWQPPSRRPRRRWRRLGAARTTPAPTPVPTVKAAMIVTAPTPTASGGGGWSGWRPLRLPHTPPSTTVVAVRRQASVKTQAPCRCVAGEDGGRGGVGGAPVGRERGANPTAVGHMPAAANIVSCIAAVGSATGSASGAMAVPPPPTDRLRAPPSSLQDAAQQNAE